MTAPKVPSLGIDEELAWPFLLGSLGIVLLHFIALIPKRSVIDLLSGTCHVALFGDLVEKIHNKRGS